MVDSLNDKLNFAVKCVTFGQLFVAVASHFNVEPKIRARPYFSWYCNYCKKLSWECFEQFRSSICDSCIQQCGEQLGFCKKPSKQKSDIYKKNLEALQAGGRPICQENQEQIYVISNEMLRF